MSTIVDKSALPTFFPTDRHNPSFWEMLGRTIATYGFLEETLGKAIFALTGTRPYSEEEVEAALESWLPTLERALSDPLGNLIDVYVKSVNEHPSATIQNLEEFEANLRKAAKLRNALCHGSWRLPNERGACELFYVEKKSKERFTSEVDVDFLARTQRGVAELSVEVMNTVTHMGGQFPGSNGPGNRVW